MVEDGHITAEQGEAARRTPLTVNPRSPRQQTFAADFFAEEVRREMTDRFGDKKLLEGYSADVEQVKETILAKSRLNKQEHKRLLDSQIFQYFFENICQLKSELETQLF